MIRVSPAAASISSCRSRCIPARKRERGFNQAELLARALRRAAADFRRATFLQRTRYTTTQTQFDRSERMENLRGAFRLRRGSNVQGLRMLLVDDVLTTGSTLSECASVLKEAGHFRSTRPPPPAAKPWPFSKNLRLRPRATKKREMPQGLWQKCPGCGEVVHEIELAENDRVCPRCDYHFTLSAKERIANLCDPESFVELDAD